MLLKNVSKSSTKQRRGRRSIRSGPRKQTTRDTAERGIREVGPIARRNIRPVNVVHPKTAALRPRQLDGGIFACRLTNLRLDDKGGRSGRELLKTIYR